jgi:S-adenosylmethionine decarboxylase
LGTQTPADDRNLTSADVMSSDAFAEGVEDLVDAFGCSPAALSDRALIADIFAHVVRDLHLSPAAPPQWVEFPDTGGLTGVLLLRESHLSCHTFPEQGIATFNLYCCRPRDEWSWVDVLQLSLGAKRVLVRRVGRGGSAGERAPLAQ